VKTFDEEIEHRYSDLLRNIEFAIVQSAREEIGLTDQDALEALEAVAADYFAEQTSRQPPAHSLGNKPALV
jgi:hypothetical protein